MKKIFRRVLALTLCLVCLLPLTAHAAAKDYVSPDELMRLSPDCFGGIYTKGSKMYVVVVARTANEKYEALADMAPVLDRLDKNEYLVAWRREGYSLRIMQREFLKVERYLMGGAANDGIGIVEADIDLENNRVKVGLSNVNAATRAAFRKTVSSHPCVAFYNAEVVLPDMFAGWGEATANVNVRSGPSTAYPKLGALKKGDKLPVIELAGSNQDWVVIAWNGVEAYVSLSYMNLPTDMQPSKQVPSTDPGDLGVAAATGTVNVRTGPGTSYGKLGQLQKGDLVAVWSISGDWAKITYGGGADSRAYVFAKYLKFR